jgi:peptidoglycan-N-acetylglucosamine deacetylase
MCKGQYSFCTFFYLYIYNMGFWVKSRIWLKVWFPNYVWKINTNEKKVYLTFDDGPTNGITEWVLEQLSNHNAKATFFCIGDKIQRNPSIFNQLLSENHSIGNHTFNHLKGWRTSTDDYIENTQLCQIAINKHTTSNSNLFRPPYGKIKPSQSRMLRKIGYKIIMWDVISYDFDNFISKEKCLENVLKNIENGSILVFHDSHKAWKNLEYVLPKTLAYLQENGFTCEKIN